MDDPVGPAPYSARYGRGIADGIAAAYRPSTPPLTPPHMWRLACLLANWDDDHAYRRGFDAGYKATQRARIGSRARRRWERDMAVYKALGERRTCAFLAGPGMVVTRAPGPVDPSAPWPLPIHLGTLP